MTPTVQSTVRLYRTIRSAHLERARQLAPATIVFESHRYDFEEGLTTGLDLVRAGPVRAAVLIARSRVRTLEINEPLMVASLARTVCVLVAVTAVGVLRRSRTQVVAYAIENLDPFTGGERRRPRAAIRRFRHKTLAILVWRRLDRVVFGTDASRELYERALPRRASLAAHTIPALPPRDGALRSVARTRNVVFLGAFTARKGFPLLVESWPIVLERRAATITVIGKGELEMAAHDWAQGDSSVELVIDPPREEIVRLLASASVLVLPSQPTAGWREQVGLPIVEGLGQGCAVVASTETGLAEWLAAHGHTVMDASGDAYALADAIVIAVDAGRTKESVLADLPDRDGRLAADDWLVGAPTDGGNADG